VSSAVDPARGARRDHGAGARRRRDRRENMSFPIGFCYGAVMRRRERVMNDPWGELSRLSFDERCRSER
jgi:hypothetical protein